MRSIYDPVSAFLGNASLSAYTFDFKIEEIDQLLVVVLNDLGVEIQRVRGSDTTYLSTVTFDAENGGGTVNLKANLPTNYQIYLLLANDSPTQPFEFKNKGDLTVHQLERALDFAAGAIQRAIYLGNRAATLHESISLDDFDPKLPIDIVGKSRYTITTNVDGDGLELGPSLDFLETLADEITIALATATAAVAAAQNALASAQAAAVAAAASEAAAVAAAAAALAAAASIATAKPLINGGRATPIDIDNITGLYTQTASYYELLYIQGNGGAVDITAVNPQIAAGNFEGQRKVVIGCSNTKTVKMTNGNGVVTAGGGDLWFFNNTCKEFIWDGTNWIERG